MRICLSVCKCPPFELRESQAFAPCPGMGAEASTEEAGPDNVSVLMDACLRGNASVAKALLAARADVEERDGIGSTPLILASLKGQDAVVRRLLDAAADHGAC